ncbi:hypothetical protein PCANC_25884 [Puccinia coronata f. sp. avenae]|uniref:Uncharacterized protein n=1 Tax=Puccinia coronata f. sp. avenae TaxID=200324 RepID=A0A2N5THW8_9BASI|nr:hypothetical protein PCANC_25884 [Puccinia coronata f. sp. avenae]
MLLVVSEDETRMRAEVMAMGLFNLVVLKPNSIASYAESRMKTRATLMRSLVRTLGRFLILGEDQVSTSASIKVLAMQALVERLLETMKVLVEQVDLKKLQSAASDVSHPIAIRGPSGGVRHAVKSSFIDPPMNWFGGGRDDDEHMMAGDRRAVRLLPKLLTGLESGEDVDGDDDSDSAVKKKAARSKMLAAHQLALVGLCSGSVRWRAEFIKMLAGFGAPIPRALLPNLPNNSLVEPSIGSLISPMAFASLVKILD